MSKREYAKLEELKAGDTVELDGGFGCCKPGLVVLGQDGEALFFLCKLGKHFVNGQLMSDGALSGIFRCEPVT